MLFDRRRRSTADDEELPATTKTLATLSSVVGAIRRYRELALERGDAAEALWANEAIDEVSAQQVRLTGQLRAITQAPQALIGSAGQGELWEVPRQVEGVRPLAEVLGILHSPKVPPEA